jgi:hypothetical protein
LLNKKKNVKSVKQQEKQLKKELQQKNKQHVNKEEKPFYKMLKKH